VKVATWNVNGIRARFDDVTAWAERCQPDVFCLQELKATPGQVPEPLTGLPAYYNHWHGGEGGYSGVSVHVRRGFGANKPEFSSPGFDFEHRIAVAELDDVVVASVYVPNGNKNFDDKITFLRALEQWAADQLDQRKHVLICGDLNVTRCAVDVHTKQRDHRTIGQTDDERKLLAAILGRGLVDVGRSLSPDDDQLFTWWPPWREEKQKNRGWRIDYVLASPDMAAQSCTVLKDEGSSDHAPVVAIF
jgi:exodeoxyribonuclease III